MFEFEGILCRHVIAVFKATNLFVFPQHYILKRWTRNATDEFMLDVPSSFEMHGNSRRGKNSHYNILYQEAIKCAEEGMASDHSFKMALNALTDARIKIIGAKKNAIDAQKLETMASTSSQDENTMSSQVDSCSELASPIDHQKAKTRESHTDNNISNYMSHQSSTNEVRLRTSCNSLGHHDHACLWLKDSDQIIPLDNENQKLSYAADPLGTGDNNPAN